MPSKEKSIEIINRYLEAQGIKERVSLAMNLQTALPLCDTAGHYGRVLLHNSKFDEGRELTEARRTLDKHFYDKARLEQQHTPQQANFQTGYSNYRKNTDALLDRVTTNNRLDAPEQSLPNRPPQPK